MAYQNMTVLVVDTDDTLGAARATVLASFDQADQHQDVAYDAETLETMRLQMAQVPEEHTMAQVAAFGQALADIILPRDIRTFFWNTLDAVTRAGDTLRLVLKINSPALACIPWEYIYAARNPQAPLALQHFLALQRSVSIVRHEVMPDPIQRVAASTPLKIFAGFAEPLGLTQFGHAAVVDVLTQEDQHSDLIDVTIKEHLHRDDLEHLALEDHHIFSFSGHGTFMADAVVASKVAALRTKPGPPIASATPVPRSGPVAAPPPQSDDEAAFLAFLEQHPENNPNPSGPSDASDEEAALLEQLSATSAPVTHETAVSEAPSEERESGFLLLEDADGEIDSYRADALATMLRDSSVRLVIMDACQAGQMNPAYKWTGVVSSLVQAGIPGVVGMQCPFTNEAAQKFWPAFYRHVAAGRPLDAAVSAARLAIANIATDAEGNRPQWDFGFPALYCRHHDGILFPTVAQDRNLKETRNHLEQEVAIIAERIGDIVEGDNVEGDNVEGDNVEGDKHETHNTGDINLSGGSFNFGTGTQVAIGHGNEQSQTHITQSSDTKTVVFTSQDDKAAFVSQMDQLVQQLMQIQMGLMQAGQDWSEVPQKMIAISEAKAAADAVDVHEPAPEKQTTIGDKLDQTKSFLDKLNGRSDTAANVGETIGPAVKAAGALLLDARHLIGLP